MLVGFAAVPKPVPPVLVPVTTQVNIPAELLIKCEPFPKLVSPTYTEGELVSIFQIWINQADACRAKDSILVDTVTKAFNIQPKNQSSK